MTTRRRTAAAQSRRERALQDKRALSDLEEQLEARIAEQLLPWCSDTPHKVEKKEERYAVMFGLGDGEEEATLGEEIADKVQQLITPESGESGSGHSDRKLWLLSRLVGPADPHTTDSPALAALLSCGVYAPVCTWVHDEGTNVGGSIGGLSKLDALRGEDWCDDFLLMAVMAHGLREVRFPIAEECREHVGVCMYVCMYVCM